MAVGKRILIIAGPNGAGKTTFAVEYLPNEADCPAFVNADLIAAGLSPFRPQDAAVRAGRLMLREIDGHARRGGCFAFETTLSGLGHARRISRWRDAGYRIQLVFLRLPTPEVAVARVAQRVAQGGHGVPESAIRRRFARGWRNFEHTYRDLADDWKLYDNAGRAPVLLADRGRPVSPRDGASAAPPGDPGFTGVDAALRRAVARARREGAAAGVPVVTFRDGEIVLEKPVRESGCAPSRRAGVSEPAADPEKPGREPAPSPGRGLPNSARDSDG